MVYQISSGTSVSGKLAAFGAKLSLSTRDWIRVQSSWASFHRVSTAIVGRVHAPGKSEWAAETLTASHKYVLWPAVRSWEFLRPKDLLLRVSTMWWRKLLLFENILRGTGRIRMLNSDYILTKSYNHRMARYSKTEQVVPCPRHLPTPSWKVELSTASVLVA